MAEKQKLIEITCPSCLFPYTVPLISIGRKVTCSKCKIGFEIQPKKNRPEYKLPSLAKVALNSKLITEVQLKEALAIQEAAKRSGKKINLRDIFVAKGMITADMMKRLITATTRQLDILFGNLVVAKGYAPQDKVNQALEIQAQEYKESQKCRMIGDILVAGNTITPEQRDVIMAEQNRIEKALAASKPAKANTQAMPPSKSVELSLSEQKFWEERKKDKTFGAIAAKKFYVTVDEVNRALEIQVKQFEENKLAQLLGDIMVRSGAMTKAQRDEILAEQGRVKKTVSTADPAAPDQTTPAIDNSKEGRYTIQLAKDGLSATLCLSGRPPEGTTIHDIRTLIRAKDIVVGMVDDEALEKYLNEEAMEVKEFVIAKGRPAKSGRDAIIKYHFDKDYLKVGAISEDGKIDFMDRGNIPHVDQGALIAEKIPAIPGEPGLDVFGTPIAVQSVKDFKLIPGPGVEISEDALQAYAKCNGQPSISVNGKLSVMAEYKIQEDIGLKTGHVEFDGNIVVGGAVQSGFRVKGGNLTAREINGAEINVTGDVKISGGITGATIIAQGDVFAIYMKDTSIKTFGNVIIGKEIIDCKIESSGFCEVKQGKIISSEITARMGVFSQQIGTEISRPCRLRTGVSDHIEREVNGIKDAITRRKEKIENLKSKKADLELENEQAHERIANYAQVQDRSMISIRDLKQELESYQKSGKTDMIDSTEKAIADFEKKAKSAEQELEKLFNRQDEIADIVIATQDQIKGLEAKINELNDEKEAIIAWASQHTALAEIKVSGMIFSGTSIHGTQSFITLKETLKNVTIKEVKNSDPDFGGDFEMRIIR